MTDHHKRGRDSPQETPKHRRPRPPGLTVAGANFVRRFVKHRSSRYPPPRFPKVQEVKPSKLPRFVRRLLKDIAEVMHETRIHLMAELVKAVVLLALAALLVTCASEKSAEKSGDTSGETKQQQVAPPAGRPVQTIPADDIRPQTTRIGLVRP